jgi:hypothetical protein
VVSLTDHHGRIQGFLDRFNLDNNICFRVYTEEWRLTVTLMSTYPNLRSYMKLISNFQNDSLCKE